MNDLFGRNIDYLRLSVTDLCDLRCVYCMDPAGVEKLAHGDILSFEALEELVRCAVALGVTKVRLTGGEPLTRRGIVTLCARLKAIPGVKELAMTTNAQTLERFARPLREAGLRARLVLQVHDELIVECPQEEAMEVCALVTAQMEQAASLSVPLTAEAKYGASWYAAK